MFEITKDFSFDAAHRLNGLSDGHKCARIHGHSYRVRVQLASPGLDPPGFVLDYADLSPFRTWLDGQWDHRWLGHGTLTGDDGTKTLPVFDGNPTAELLAAHFRDWITTVLFKDHPGLAVAVGVSETLKTWAWSR